MYVKCLELSNLRSFEHLKINFSRNINIFTGHNNSGKSTVIKSLYKMQNPRSLNYEDIRVHKTYADILVGLDDISNTDNENYFNVKHPLPSELSDCLLKFRTIRATDLEKKYVYKKDPSAELISLEHFDTFHQDQMIMRDFFEFPSTEDQNNFIYPFFSKRKINYYSSQSGKTNTYNVLDNFQNLPAKVQKTASQAATKEEYDRLCKDILGFTVNAIPGDDNDNKLGIYPTYNSTISLESMGEGVANIIGLITILLTEDNKLFLLEELENDIHPTALKKLLRLIADKSEKNQFVISTHSNIVLKQLGVLPTTKIFYTDYSPNGIRENNVPISTITEVKNTPQERLKILEQLGYELLDYEIYKGYIIFEESTAERIVRDFIIPLFVPDAKYKIRTIAAQGVSNLEVKFSDLNGLFIFLHTSEVYKDKAWVIADGDDSGREAILNLKKRYSNWNESHFLNFEKLNFEQYYPIQFQPEVDSIMLLRSSKEKQEKKMELFNRVIEWIEADLDTAKNALEISAAEVILKIKSIIDKLDRK